ncbi:MAG: DUF512 domain-containing protein [Acidaminobacteraceae bacterium]
MSDKANVISKVLEGSIASELGIVVGDCLLSINGNEVVDIIDYLFLVSDDYIEIEVEKSDGEIWDYEIDKEFDEEIGIEFSNPIMSDAKNCSNNCIFCFVDQLPENMRESLYFKDDDSRLSFLQGNFVTLTNVAESELDRIVEYNISPINVSIHTTNPKLRAKMLNNRFAGNINERLNKLTSNRIEVNGQVVLCPGYNDKEELDRTLKDLYNMKYGLKSLAIVPIGKTRYRDGLADVETFERDSARDVIKQVEKWQEFFLEKTGSRFVFLSDEFYVIAESELPKAEAYEGFELIEDGIGLMVKFKEEIKAAIKEDILEVAIEKKKRIITVATGASAYKFMSEIAEMAMSYDKSLEINVYHILNDFFGHTITVAGLLTSVDIYKQLQGKNVGDVLLIPKSMMKSDENVFLDDVSVEDLSKRLGVEIKVVEVEGYDFLNGCLS